MGTLLESPRSPQSHNKTKRPRPVVPIVPAVPRPVNAKRKHQIVVKQPAVNGSRNGTASSNGPPIEWDGGAPLIVDGSAQCSDAKDDPGDKGNGEAAGVIGGAVDGTYRATEAMTEGKSPGIHRLTVRLETSPPVSWSMRLYHNA